MYLPRITYLVTLLGVLIWCGLILAAPLLAGSNSSFSGPIYQGFHQVCHQFEDRSFHLVGQPLPVCTRCTAIYFAFLVGVLIYPLVRRLNDPQVPSRSVVFVAVLPMVFDVAAGMLGVHQVTTPTRITTGALFGFAITFVILPAAIEAVHQIVSASRIINKWRGTTDARKSQ
jgi:uncharacterized membrane protein